jgi:hypothetical protein
MRFFQISLVFMDRTTSQIKFEEDDDDDDYEMRSDRRDDRK